MKAREFSLAVPPLIDGRRGSVMFRVLITETGSYVVQIRNEGGSWVAVATCGHARDALERLHVLHQRALSGGLAELENAPGRALQ